MSERWMLAIPNQDGLTSNSLSAFGHTISNEKLFFQVHKTPLLQRKKYIEAFTEEMWKFVNNATTDIHPLKLYSPSLQRAPFT